eukprot:2999677-Rhodomonas_salina.1
MPLRRICEASEAVTEFVGQRTRCATPLSPSQPQRASIAQLGVIRAVVRVQPEIQGTRIQEVLQDPISSEARPTIMIRPLAAVRYQPRQTLMEPGPRPTEEPWPGCKYQGDIGNCLPQ